MRLGVNVDHVATLREARGTLYPDPVVAALLAEYAGCDSIVVHLREDRRHIKERDVVLIKNKVKIPLNLEMSINKSIVDFAVVFMPDQATLVPERRQELTTEGGLDLRKHYSA
ncbi:MAG: pyridoxine 5'-phosphate synthase, partial [Candidatus Omnitrophota bacterium]